MTTAAADEVRAYGRDDPAVLRVALIYMLTAFAIFCAMGILGLLMRLTHANWVVLPLDTFYRVMTFHGTGMVSAMLLAGMGGMIAALSRSVKLSVRWLWAAYFVYSLSIVFMFFAIVLGRFAGAWTALDPLPYQGKTWDVWAGVVQYIALLCVGLGLTLFANHVLLALVRKYGGISKALAWRYLISRGPADPNVQVPSSTELAALAVSIIGLITGIIGIAVLAVLFANAAGGISETNKLYTKNLEMFFGHAIANIAIYLAVGLVYAMIPIYTKRGNGPTSRVIVLAWNLTILLVITPTSHHLYQDFAQPMGFQIVGQISSWAVIPELLLLTILVSLSHIYRSGVRWTVPSIFIAMGFWGWVFGGIGAVIDASIPANNLTHNTLWVPAHFHTYYLLAVAPFIWGYLWYLIGDLSDVPERPSSKYAAWLYGIAGAGFVLMFFLAGADSEPRRYAVHLPSWWIHAQVAVPFVVLIILSLLWLMSDVGRGFGRAWRAVNVPAPEDDLAEAPEAPLATGSGER